MSLKPVESASRLLSKCIGMMFCGVALVSLAACDRGNADRPSAKEKGGGSVPVSATPSSEGVQPPLRPEEPPAESVDPTSLVGRWVRTDTPYVIEIRSAQDDGTLDAAYYNPNPINVARAEARQKPDGLEVFVELRDVNYPGSTYTLTYDRTNDYLSGIYFQAVHQQSFPIAFVREPAER